MKRTLTCAISAARAALNPILVAAALGGVQLAGAAGPAAGPASPSAVSRVLHFPQDRSLGMLYVLDAGIQREIKDYYYWVDGTETEWESPGRGHRRGRSAPRPARAAGLEKTSGNDLSPLSNLDRTTSDALHIGPTSGDGCLAHVAASDRPNVLDFPVPFGSGESGLPSRPAG